MEPDSQIKKAAIIGTGNMGVQIACMLANVNVDVLLLEKPANGQKDEELIDRANSRLRKGIEKFCDRILHFAFTNNFSPPYLFSPRGVRI